MTATQLPNALALDRALRDALVSLDRDPVTAAEKLRRVIAAFPDHPIGYRARALALRRAGYNGEAAEADRASIAVSTRQAGFRAAVEAMKDNRLEDAEKLIRQHLRQDPEDAAAARLLGDIAARCGANDEAERLFRRALVLAPGYLDVRINLATLLNRLHRNDDALVVLDEILAQDADHRDALTLKAAILTQDRRLDEADATFRQLTKSHSKDPSAWLNYGFLLKTTGRIDDAISAYRRSVLLDPDNGIAWWGLANLKTVAFDDADVIAVRKALGAEDGDVHNRVHLQFALGKGLGDQRDYAGSFAAYTEGNRLRREQAPHDANPVTDNVIQSEGVFTPAFFAGRVGWGCPAPDPIFVVSLPRSGSTLVEQILASHPMIEGTEELHNIEQIALDLAPGKPQGSYIAMLADLPRAKIRELGEIYLESTRRYRQTGRPFFIDKMPGNWAFVGLIHLILPNAKIIDIRRHPLSCGFANFAQHFNWGINFSYDLVDIGKFYSAYVRQMAHFDRVLPGRVHHIVYERLVDDLEAEVRGLLNHLGLPFDPACLRFFENTRAVHTPSAEQVRQPINRDGVDRWRDYEAWLSPLKDALGPVLDHYPDTPPHWRAGPV